MFFLVKAADEIGEGNFKAALSTLTSGASPTVKTVEDDLGDAVNAFLAVFGPAEAKTILTSLSTTVTTGVAAGVASAEAGTVANAEAGAEAAGQVLANDAQAAVGG